MSSTTTSARVFCSIRPQEGGEIGGETEGFGQGYSRVFILPILHLSASSLEELVNDLARIERCILKEMGFVCHVEHPHKFIPSSLRTTLCVRFKSEVVYGAARILEISLLEDQPWWTLFDADEAGIQQVCIALAQLYSLAEAEYIPVYRGNGSFAVTT